MGDEPVTKQVLASFKDFVVSQLALHKSVISWEVQKSQEARFLRMRSTFLPEKRVSSGEERGLLSRTAAGNRAYPQPPFLLLI